MSWDHGKAVDTEVIFQVALPCWESPGMASQSQTFLQPSQAAEFPGSAILVLFLRGIHWKAGS